MKSNPSITPQTGPKPVAAWPRGHSPYSLNGRLYIHTKFNEKQQYLLKPLWHNDFMTSRHSPADKSLQQEAMRSRQISTDCNARPT